MASEYPLSPFQNLANHTHLFVSVTCRYVQQARYVQRYGRLVSPIFILALFGDKTLCGFL